jgi:hypothetical protein
VDGDGRRSLILTITVGRVAPEPGDGARCAENTDAWIADLDAVKAGRIHRGERATVELLLRNMGASRIVDLVDGNRGSAENRRSRVAQFVPVLRGSG